MFKVVAFDMDGTIADTIPMCIEAFKNSVSPYTDHELSEEEIVNTFGLNEVGMVKSVVSQNWKSAINDFYYQYEYLHNNVTEVFDGILNLFELLKYKKIIVALITQNINNGEEGIIVLLDWCRNDYDMVREQYQVKHNLTEDEMYEIMDDNLGTYDFMYDEIPYVSYLDDIWDLCNWYLDYVNGDITEKDLLNLIK